MLPFYAGLMLVVVGTGFFKPNVSTMVGQLYAPDDRRRDAGFTIFYMGINLGASIAPFICGTLGQSPRFGWHYGFGAAGVGMLLGLGVYFWGRERLLPGVGLAPVRDAAAQQARVTAGGGWRQSIPGLAAGALGAAIGWFAGGWLGLVMLAVIGWALGTSIFGSRGEERERVIAIFVIVFFVIFFWAAFEQAGSSLNLFADRNTRLDLGVIRLRSTWLQAVGPVTIVLFAPLFAVLWTRARPRGTGAIHGAQDGRAGSPFRASASCSWSPARGWPTPERWSAPSGSSDATRSTRSASSVSRRSG